MFTMLHESGIVIPQAARGLWNLLPFGNQPAARTRVKRRDDVPRNYWYGLLRVLSG